MSFTVTVTSASSLSDEYADVETLPMKVDESPIAVKNAMTEPLKHFETAALELEETVLGETITVKVPCLTWAPSSPCTSGSTLSISSTSSTVPTSPASEKQETPIPWSNNDLLYLTSILKPHETSSNTLIFTPPLSDLDNTSTYPIHLQLHTKLPPCIPPLFTSNPYSRHAPIGTGRPSHLTLLLAESSKQCSTPSAARRSLAQALLSDSQAVSAELDRCNVLCTFYSTPPPTLDSILRGMHLMAGISDAEWLGRLAQLRGTVNNQGIIECVDTTCGVEARIEYFLLEMGRRALQGWVRCLAVCLEVREGEERGVCRDVYGDAARFLVRAYREVGGWSGDAKE